MDNLSTFMLFESMQQLPQGCQLVNPLPVILPISIPGNYSFVLAFTAFGITSSDDHIVSLALECPNGTIIKLLDDQRITPPSPINSPTKAAAHPNGAIAMNLDIRNFPFNEEGVYKFIIIVDDKRYEHCFPVYKKDVT